MNRNRQRRLYLLLAISAAAAAVIGLSLVALRQNINLYYTPHELVAAHITPRQVIRLGGWVQPHSLRYQSGQRISFHLTDHKDVVTVHYSGILPSLFREGQGVVVAGHWLPAGYMQADQVLAKHDENYHPPKLVEKKLTKDSL